MKPRHLLILPLVGLALLGLYFARGNKPGVQAAQEKPNGDAFGYTVAFDDALKSIGPITPAEFADRHERSADYLPKMSWDPTTAASFAEYDLATTPKPGTQVFRLNAEERSAFTRNGFVVSERLGAASFSQMLYQIYSRDLPIYISSDTILHAWHRSYDAMLEELEEAYLSVVLGEILTGMADALPQAKKEYGAGPLADGLADADYFVAVARSLLAGKPVSTELGQEARVAETLKACEELQLQRFDLFGRRRDVDFSQFKVRGHYENSERLKRYFTAMMWCGRIDLRVAGNPEESSPRELGGAVVLHDLLRRADKFTQWEQFDRLLQTFVGRTDSMTFAQLGDLLKAGGIRSPADVVGLPTLDEIRARIQAGTLGMQHIRGDVYVSPFGPEKMQLPRSFTVLGQKFTLDSWAMSKVVFDDVMWGGEKVQRRIPSCLDVAYAVLGNDATVPLLTKRMQDKDGRLFRDGLNYQHNLAATRRVIDSQDKEVWDENLYNGWLGCLRRLSTPTTDKAFPEAMRTEAWAMKNLNTQMASWTQMRHDTILYVKQSYTNQTKCEYPAGYVEPLPEFWGRFGKLASRAADLIESNRSRVGVAERPPFG